jgi:putative membrane protein
MIHKIALGFATLTALLHFYFMYLEIFVWTKPKGLKIFKQSLAQAKASAKLAMNQGLYNGFLGAGLLWGISQSLAHPDHDFGSQIILFFSACVFIAGIAGALTANKKIFFIQGLPALITMGLILVS